MWVYQTKFIYQLYSFEKSRQFHSMWWMIVIDPMLVDALVGDQMVVDALPVVPSCDIEVLKWFCCPLLLSNYSSYPDMLTVLETAILGCHERLFVYLLNRPTEADLLLPMVAIKISLFESLWVFSMSNFSWLFFYSDESLGPFTLSYCQPPAAEDSGWSSANVWLYTDNSVTGRSTLCWTITRGQT